MKNNYLSLGPFCDNITRKMDPKTLSGVGAKESEKMCVSGDNKAKGWFLTYPKCPCPMSDLLMDLTDNLALQKLAIVEYVICEEKHADGTPHLHAFIKLDKRVRFKENRFNIIFDGKEYHGNYQIAKSWDAVKGYVVKGHKYIANIDVKQALKKQSKKIGAKELEMDPLDALEQGIITGFQLCNFVKNQNMYNLLKNKRKAITDIDLNVEKKRHVWYYGESNSGKTYRIKSMILEDNKKDEKEREGWFQIPTNNDWTGYTNQKNLYIDEFKGQLTIQEINRICDGSAKVNTKGGSVQLASNVVVYVCSNYNIKNCYKKTEDMLLESLYNRFNEKMCAKSGEEYVLVE